MTIGKTSTTPPAVTDARNPIRTLNTPKIMVLILASLTPITVVIGTIPFGLAFGGPTTTLMFIICGGIIALFCVGYTQMVRRISRPGAFYSYIARGLGRPAGVGGAMVAVVSYIVGAVASYAALAVVGTQTLNAMGVGITWPWVFGILVAVIALLMWFQIDTSVAVVRVIVVAEVALILALVVAIVVRNGSEAFAAPVFSFDVFQYGNWSVAFIFAILVFQGFEAGAMYAPEALRPERTIPRALYGSLIVSVVIYVVISWVLVSLTGVAGASDAFLAGNFSEYIFTIVADYLGPIGASLFSLGALLALVACTVSLTNFMSRYLNGLARDELLPRPLAALNRHGSPVAASSLLIGLSVVCVTVTGLLGLDPYVALGPVGFGLGAVGSTVLQALASASVVGYFLQQHAQERHWWKTLVAPSLATLLLIGALIVELMGFTYVTGSTQTWTQLLPWVIVAALVFGIGFGYWLRLRRPDIYLDLAAGESAEDAALLRAGRLSKRLSPMD